MEKGIEIVKHEKNPLMHREEILLAYAHAGKPTPSKKEMIPHIAKKLGVGEDVIIIDKVFNIKGEGRSNVKVLAYKKKEDIPKYKLEKMLGRMEKKKDEVKEEHKKEEKAAAKPEKKGKEK